MAKKWFEQGCTMTRASVKRHPHSAKIMMLPHAHVAVVVPIRTVAQDARVDDVVIRRVSMSAF
jgi:hypothetical protein